MSERLRAALDLAGADVLDFTVQAVLPDAVRALVLTHLRAGHLVHVSHCAAPWRGGRLLEPPLWTGKSPRPG